MKIYIEFNLTNSPTGGGNQFLFFLKEELVRRNLYIIPEGADVILYNAHHNPQEVVDLKQKYPDKIFIHRTNGLYKLYNNQQDPRQDIAMNLNNLATGTIFQSNWAKHHFIQYGFNPNKPHTTIINATNDNIFKYSNKINKNRLLCTCNSDNINKGWDYYKWLDDNLDFNKYEFTIIGNKPNDMEFENIKYVLSLPTGELAREIINHDIFISASRNECCSNSILEALSCGLPCVALFSGGNQEIIKNGGKLFFDVFDLINSIDKVSSNIEHYKNNITIDTIQQVTDRYLDFFKEFKK
jgi:glycosyltransferase involved in cell wall biosynthesis